MALLPAYTNFTFSSHPYDRKSLAISRDGQRLAVGVGSSVVLWDLGTYRHTDVLLGHSNLVTFVRLLGRRQNARQCLARWHRQALADL